MIREGREWEKWARAAIKTTLYNVLWCTESDRLRQRGEHYTPLLECVEVEPVISRRYSSFVGGGGSSCSNRLNPFRYAVRVCWQDAVLQETIDNRINFWIPIMIRYVMKFTGMI